MTKNLFDTLKDARALIFPLKVMTSILSFDIRDANLNPPPRGDMMACSTHPALDFFSFFQFLLRMFKDDISKMYISHQSFYVVGHQD